MASISAFEDLVQGITYNNTSALPSENRSLSFDGENDYIAIADSDQLDQQATSAWKRGSNQQRLAQELEAIVAASSSTRKGRINWPASLTEPSALPRA